MIHRLYKRANRLLRRLSGEPAPHSPKVNELIKYAQRSENPILIETGTKYGDTVAAVRRAFYKIYSIELSQTLYDHAQRRFADDPDVTIINGDSGQHLESLLSTLNSPVIFFLDAHYSGGDTARGSEETPIENELSVILSSSHRHIVLIHDAHEFGSNTNYPSFERIQQLVHAYGYTINVWEDIIHITPDSS